MACNENQQKWTIVLKTDARPNLPSQQYLVEFCLTIRFGFIAGSVFYGGNPLSAVTGTFIPVPGTRTSFMSLLFDWDSTSIMLSGTAYERFGSTDFEGRFWAAALLSQAAPGTTPVILGPGDGDTGTGTGSITFV